MLTSHPGRLSQLNEKIQTNLLVTGPPGIGKTTMMRRLAERLTERWIAGFVTDEIREKGNRAGFALSPFGPTERKIMAHKDLVSLKRVGRYGVDVECIDYITDLTLSVRASADVFLVDEIGKMECFSERFVHAMRALLDDPRPVVATVAIRGPGLIEEVKNRDDVILWTLTRENRDDMPDRITDWISGCS
jgi:nucleoside-triphosphatase